MQTIVLSALWTGLVTQSPLAAHAQLRLQQRRDLFLRRLPVVSFGCCAGAWACVFLLVFRGLLDWKIVGRTWFALKSN